MSCKTFKTTEAIIFIILNVSNDVVLICFFLMQSKKCSYIKKIIHRIKNEKWSALSCTLLLFAISHSTNMPYQNKQGKFDYSSWNKSANCTNADIPSNFRLQMYKICLSYKQFTSFVNVVKKVIVDRWSSYTLSTSPVRLG